MSKTTTPPSKETLDKLGIRFIPTNCFAPNHYLVKHQMFAFNGFDTASQYIAMKEAALVNAIAAYLDVMGKRDIPVATITYKSILRLLGSNSDQSK